jgi:Leucine-rich repeat (LRR) protein
LSLSDNQLTRVPATLGKLTALKVLYLGGNPLQSVPAEWEKGRALEQNGCDIFWESY